LIILDVKMPGLDGLGLLKLIKARPRAPQVLLLTGNATVADGVEGIRSGAFDYLTKPVEIDHLVNKIHQALEMAALEQKIVDAERMAALGILSTGIAHEINNPLAVINEAAGLMGQILEQDGASPLVFKALDKIQSSVKRARTITHQLLGYARQGDPCRIQVDLGALFQEIHSLVKKNLAGKNITLDYPKEGLPDLNTDPDRLRQILLNLVTNAAQAQPDGGTINLSVHHTPQGICIKVKDQGPGIDPAHMDKIFHPFFFFFLFDQGTGLGLFVVHKLASQLGAKITVRSPGNEGTSFFLTFPRTLNPSQGEKDD
ncbi:MAG: ATP-binding protein, partial [Desulfovibrionales bacterium]|nr:ATP-binding protein [Desulfovibrionales bacterium]